MVTGKVSDNSANESGQDRHFVFCPTRDRPEQLARTVCALVEDMDKEGCPDSRLIVVDDSTTAWARRRNREVLFQQVAVTYHGPEEQKRVLSRLEVAGVIGAGVDRLERFVRLLGGKDWDLGGVRNYLGLLGIALTAGKRSYMAMIDDDVELEIARHENRTSSLGRLWRAVEQGEDFIVGAQLAGMPDVSMVERTELEFRKARGLPVIELCGPPFPVSGGFLGCHRKWIMRAPFPREYNEDWMWLASCSWRGADTIRSSAQGFHAWSPMKHCEPQDLERELTGEVLCSGLLLAYARSAEADGLSAVVDSRDFWREVIRDEYDDLAARRQLLHEQWKQHASSRIKGGIPEVVDRALEILDGMNEDGVLLRARTYLTGMDAWSTLLRSVESWVVSTGTPVVSLAS